MYGVIVDSIDIVLLGGTVFFEQLFWSRAIYPIRRISSSEI